MRIVITGATGQLGQELQATAPPAYQISALTRQQLDLTQPETFAAKIASLNPAVIINTAAYTAVDKAETEVELAYAINADAAEKLALAAKQHGARFIHISTDFVFDGMQSKPYKPDDKPNPLNSYGRSKWLGEKKVLEVMSEALILRTSWVYSSHGHNFVKTILRLLQEREELKIVADQVGTPTSAYTLARSIWAVIEQPTLSGIYHCSDAGVASWYDFAVAIQEEGIALGLLKQSKPIYPINTADFPVPAKRPTYSVLDKTDTWRDFKLPPRHWRDSLRAMLTDYSHKLSSNKTV